MSRRTIVVALVLGAISLMIVVGLVLAVVTAARGDGLGLGGRIAILEVEGIIAEDEELLEQIRRFRNDASVEGFVVAINSPGGVVGPSQSVYRELRKVREEDGLPVVASIGGVGASGGYYIALAADSIFVLPGSITGSIGVVMEMPNATELMNKVGVQMQVVESAEHKTMGSPFQPLSEGDREILERLVDDIYEQFVEVVLEERGLGREELAPLADGRILSGRQALAAGLVDRTGNLHDALAAAGEMAGLGRDPRTVRPPEERFGMLDLLLGASAAAVVESATAPLRQGIGPAAKYVVPFSRGGGALLRYIPSMYQARRHHDEG